MDIFGLLSLIGGLALFLYGMHVLGVGLEKMSGGRLERILERLTSNPLKGVVLGAFVTAAIQSSTATTVMVVGFVNSGIMKFSQAIGIIMGANVGTTITSWILSLSGIEGDSILLQLLKPTSFSPVLALIGIIFLMSKKGKRRKVIGEIFLGFAILMYGMHAMSSAVEPLAEVPEFANILVKFQNPVLGVLAGALLTAIIQSSSASVGILQALSGTGAFTYESVIPIIMGQNIGTCVTAMLSAMGASRNGKRTAYVHLYFNLIGAVLFLVAYYVLNGIFHFPFAKEQVGYVGIAMVHSVFNLSITILLLPGIRLLERLAYLTIPVREEEKSATEEVSLVLDERFLSTPAFAIEHCYSVAKTMANLAQESFQLAIRLVDGYSEEMAEKVFQKETQIDQYEDKLRSYLTRLNSENLSNVDSQSVSTMLHCITDFERISDYAENVAQFMQEMHREKQTFSEIAFLEMKVFGAAVEKIISLAMEGFTLRNEDVLKNVEPLEEVIDELDKKVKRHHVKRLREGKCTIEVGLILTELATAYERVADHCSNIAVYMMQAQDNMVEEHGYARLLRQNMGEDYERRVDQYRQQYRI